MRKQGSENHHPSKKKFVKYLLGRDSSLNEQNVIPVLNGIERFVRLIHKVYKEPQAQVRYKTKKINGEKEEIRIIETTIGELGKLSHKKPYSLQKALRELNQATFQEKIIEDDHE